jgi:putative Mg2+ transporter-C (MgtC) family protein
MVRTGGHSFRIAAQVFSGIGFLAAGLFLPNGPNITGLNTAATLWCSAAIDVEHTDEVAAQAIPTSTVRQSSSRS